MSKEQEKELLEEYDSYEGFGVAAFMLAVIAIVVVVVVIGIVVAVVC